jgi:hypothetical protein
MLPGLPGPVRQVLLHQLVLPRLRVLLALLVVVQLLQGHC